MQYLIRKKKAKVAHIFSNNDTACRLYSTSGMNKKRYKVTIDKGQLDICLMCSNVYYGHKDASKQDKHERNKELARLIADQKRDIKREVIVCPKKR